MFYDFKRGKKRSRRAPTDKLRKWAKAARARIARGDRHEGHDVEVLDIGSGVELARVPFALRGAMRWNPDRAKPADVESAQLAALHELRDRVRASGRVWESGSIRTHRTRDVHPETGEPVEMWLVAWIANIPESELLRDLRSDAVAFGLDPSVIEALPPSISSDGIQPGGPMIVVPDQS
jgi:hypothetical protein